MDEIKIYNALMQASCSWPSGIGDIRDAAWKGVDEAVPANADEEGYGYINLISARISSMAAAVMLSCVHCRLSRGGRLYEGRRHALAVLRHP